MVEPLVQIELLASIVLVGMEVFKSQSGIVVMDVGLQSKMVVWAVRWK